MSIGSYLWGWRNTGIQKGDLVLEVGSGGRPLARSDVLCDMFLDDDCERAEGQLHFPIVTDRPMVCANAERLPFRDGTFDALVSFHTLEHLRDPEAFLKEAMRVARKGYIVAPSRVCELLTPRNTHLWLVDTDASGSLLLDQKIAPDLLGVGGVFHSAWQKDVNFRRFFFSRPDIFEARFAYDGPFDYKITRPSEVPEWFVQAELDPAVTISRGSGLSLTQRMARTARTLISSAIRTYHSPRFDFWSLLACPSCHEGLDRVEERLLRCTGCGSTYRVRLDDIPILLDTHTPHETGML